MVGKYVEQVVQQGETVEKQKIVEQVVEGREMQPTEKVEQILVLELLQILVEAVQKMGIQASSLRAVPQELAETVVQAH